MKENQNDNSSSLGAVEKNNQGSDESEMDIAEIQAEKMIDKMEEEISKLETDYTGEYRRGF